MSRSKSKSKNRRQPRAPAKDRSVSAPAGSVVLPRALDLIKAVEEPVVAVQSPLPAPSAAQVQIPQAEAVPSTDLVQSPETAATKPDPDLGLAPEPMISPHSDIAADCLTRLESVATLLSMQSERHEAQLAEIKNHQDDLLARSLRCETVEVRLAIATEVLRQRQRRLRDLIAKTKKLRDRTKAQRQRVVQFVRRRLSQSVSIDAFERHSTESCNTIERLNAELELARAECDEMRCQLHEMASKLANSEVRRADVTGRVSQESLTWDQRKEMMLARLSEEEGHSVNDTELESVRAMCERAELDIRRKDQEIAELRNLLQEQSNSANGVVIGAAAFAQMFDSDEIIREERDKLREMQQQWEGKLREAEIELSLERARLARQRTELEQQSEALREKLHEIQQQEALRPADSKRPPVRRWLAQLGLGDDA